MMFSAIRTLIADDEPVARRGIRRLLASDPDLEIVGEARNGAETVASVARTAAELLFLDVEMPDKSGLQCLREIDSPRPVVVFVTAYEHYALRAFEAEALDYLLKPFSDDRLAAVVVRAKEQVRQRRLGALDARLDALVDRYARLHDSLIPESATHGTGRFATRLSVRRRAGVALVPVVDIDWIEAAGYQARIHAAGHTHLLREPLQRLETRLDPMRFVRIHRSFIVQVDRIREIQPYFRGAFVVILNDGRRLMLSRRRRAALEGVLGHRL
jgi:two-component system LytT family response regulator